MRWKKYLLLIVGGAICLLLAIAAILVLIKLNGTHRSVQADLASTSSRLDSLNRRQPYPSAENVELAQKNLAMVGSYYSNLVSELVRDQPTAAVIGPAEFATLLERTAMRVREKAMASGVALPERFALGFDKYAAGELPATDHLPRLIVQTKLLEDLMGLLFDARISSVVSLQRVHFDDAQATTTEQSTTDMSFDRRRRAAAGGGGEQAMATQVPETATNEMYAVERFTVTFTAHESALWEAMNSLARAKSFFVLVDAQVNSSLSPGTWVTAVAPAPAATTPGATQERIPTHEERIMAGREYLTVSLVLDAYRFAAPVTAGEGQP